MTKARLVLIGSVGLGIVALVACGGDDSSAVTPSDDGGADATGDQTTGGDSAVDTGADAGSDTGTADGATDAGDAGDASDAPADGPRSLDGALCNGGAIGLTAVSPQFGWNGGTTAITITGTGFVATPTVYLHASGDAGAGYVAIPHAAFVSSTSISALVPSGVTPGLYDVDVANPDTCAATLPGAFKVVANATPQIVDVSPGAGTTQVDTDVTVTGCHFPSNATLSTVDSTGAVVLQTVTGSVTCTGPVNVCADGSPLCTMTGTIKSTTLVAGAYLVRVTNPTDVTWDDWSLFVVTNPAQKLSGSYVAGGMLNTGRRAHALESGRVTDAARFLYAVGGEDGSGAALKSVEVAPLDKFGQTGAWFVQKEQLQTARSGLAVVRQGKYLYAIGGTSSNNDGTKGTAPTGSPLGSIERARILDATQAPVVTDPPTTSAASGTLAKGTWYYKVAAVMSGSNADNPAGETVASDEVIAHLAAAGNVQLAWTAVAGADHYKVYRSPTADGTSQSEVLIKDNVPGLTYTDSGDTAGSETYVRVGSTGKWVTQTAALLHGRFNTAAAIAPDGAGGLRVFVVGGWGQCLGAAQNAVMGCAESATINAAGDVLGAPFVEAVGTGLTPRMRHGLAVLTSANAPAGAPAATDFLVVAGGYGGSIADGAVQYATVAGGVTGNWTTAAAQFGQTRDGNQFAIVNGEAYQFMGGTAPNLYKDTGFLSALGTITATNITFGSWSSNTKNLGTNLGRFGLTVESAYFYVAGGTTNDTDALKQTWQILY